MSDKVKDRPNGAGCMIVLLVLVGITVLLLTRGCWINLFKSDYDRAVETEHEAYEMLRKSLGEGSYRAERDMKERDRFWKVYNEAL